MFACLQIRIVLDWIDKGYWTIFIIEASCISMNLEFTDKSARYEYYPLQK